MRVLITDFIDGEWPEEWQPDEENEWEGEWVGMPEYNNSKQKDPAITATFKFRNQEDFDEFNGLIKEHVYKRGKVFNAVQKPLTDWLQPKDIKVFDGMQRKDRKVAWYPPNAKASNYRYVDGDTNPRFPIYVISKGRWDRRQTSKTLESMDVPYRIVVEPDEYDNYAEFIDESKILVLPSNLSELGQGSVPVRNWVWEHSVSEGHEWHWILDDNIESVERYNNNMKVKCETGTPFYIVEDFVLRYENIAQAGMHYAIFCPNADARPPLHFNTRIYSCILIRNDTGFKWRGKYNEDTDLSIRMLKDGWATVMFRAFLIGKRATMTQKGGNEGIYDETDNRLEFAESLRDQHPDVVEVKKRFGRWHHVVDYRPFKKNKLIRKEGLEIPQGTNNYEMTLDTHS